MFLSIVVPAFNEGAKITKDIEKTAEYLRSRPYQSQLLIVDDGSRDATLETARRAAATASAGTLSVEVLSYGQNRGKGYAIRHGMQRAGGTIVGFMDSGLCVPLRFVESAIAKIQAGADYAIASRRLEGTVITEPQPLYRRAGSQVFWHLMRSAMGVNATDTQCGFKFYRKEAAQKIFNHLKTDGFMFDIEALLVAKKLGLKGAEFPVEWANDSDTRYRPVAGTVRNFKELARIRYRLLREGVPT